MEHHSSELNPGITFAGRYLVEKVLGDGGMGKVYLVSDQMLGGDKVALKILRPDMCADEKHVKRFLREVQLTRKVAHPNVVRTFDVAWHDEKLFFTMEYVEGATLRDRLLEGPLSPHECMKVLVAICRGLSAIHAQEIIHRDLKPGNIIISADGVVKIADFGVARPGLTDLTSPNEVVGSAGYMAPELWTGNDIDIRSDIYALGVLTYEMLTGILPFDGESATEVMNKHFEYQPPALQKRMIGVPEWLDRLILGMLEKDPQRRPKNADDIASIVEVGLKQPDSAPQGKRPLVRSPQDTKDHENSPKETSIETRSARSSGGRSQRKMRMSPPITRAAYPTSSADQARRTGVRTRQQVSPSVTGLGTIRQYRGGPEISTYILRILASLIPAIGLVFFIIGPLSSAVASIIENAERSNDVVTLIATYMAFAPALSLIMGVPALIMSSVLTAAADRFAPYFRMTAFSFLMISALTVLNGARLINEYPVIRQMMSPQGLSSLLEASFGSALEASMLLPIGTLYEARLINSIPSLAPVSNMTFGAVVTYYLGFFAYIAVLTEIVKRAFQREFANSIYLSPIFSASLTLLLAVLLSLAQNALQTISQLSVPFTLRVGTLTIHHPIVSFLCAVIIWSVYVLFVIATCIGGKRR